MSALEIARALSNELVGESGDMIELRQQVARVADCNVNLLLLGESGTGKELVARLVHRVSARRDRPFVGVNCAAVHETLLESELFGHEAGAFTGAGVATPGLLRACDGGTILLDEVGDMSPSLQSKLLRVLEERAVTPVGGVTPRAVDVRVIAATHHDLPACVRQGTFREDLYYRLNVVCLSIPPLRERRSDIPPLAEHMTRRVADVLGLPLRRIRPEAMAMFVRYDWPGNVRQLGNVIQRAYVLGQGAAISPADLPVELLGTPVAQREGFPTLREASSRHVRCALELAGGVRSRAARMLGIDRKTLWRIMRRYAIQ